MVVAVDGTEPARAAGPWPRRTLRAVLITASLAAAAWLGTALLTSGTAAAEPNPPANGDPLGLVDGLTATVDGVLDTATTTVDQVLDTATEVAEPLPAPPAVRIEPDPAKPAVVDRKAPPEPDRPPAPQPAAPPQPQSQPELQVTATAPPAPPRPVVVRHEPAPVAAPSPQRTDRTDDRAPARAPRGPTAPVVPAGAASAHHDGFGHDGHGVLTEQPAGTAPGGTDIADLRANETGGRAPGLPALSPD